MTAREFCYWLQGYFEIAAETDDDPWLSPSQAGCVQRHLALVFKHEIDPSYDGDQAVLQAVHDGAKAKQEPRPDTVRPEVTMRC